MCIRDRFVTISGTADVYDALSSDRAYHKAMLPHEALKVVFSQRDKSFARDWVDRFIQCLGIYPPGTTVRFNTGEVGVVLSVNRAALLRPRVRIVLNPWGEELERAKLLDLAQDPFSYQEIESVVDPNEFAIEPSKYFDS